MNTDFWKRILKTNLSKKRESFLLSCIESYTHFFFSLRFPDSFFSFLLCERVHTRGYNLVVTFQLFFVLATRSIHYRGLNSCKKIIVVVCVKLACLQLITCRSYHSREKITREKRLQELKKNSHSRHQHLDNQRKINFCLKLYLLKKKY